MPGWFKMIIILGRAELVRELKGQIRLGTKVKDGLLNVMPS